MNNAVIIRDELLVLDSAVRREYLKLPDDLATLTRCFGITLPPQLHRDAAVLSLTIECADRLLDAIPDAAARERFGAEVTARFQGMHTTNGDITSEFIDWLRNLREVARRHGVSREFAKIIRDIFDNAEAMRTTESLRAFVRHAEREGRLMVELLLLIIGQWTTPEFDDFMRRVAVPANLADKLRDARRDFARGEINICPGIGFRLWLTYEIVRRTRRSGRSAWAISGFCNGD